MTFSLLCKFKQKRRDTVERFPTTGFKLLPVNLKQCDANQFKVLNLTHLMSEQQNLCDN
jgi:hypothetical protein